MLTVHGRNLFTSNCSNLTHLHERRQFGQRLRPVPVGHADAAQALVDQQLLKLDSVQSVPLGEHRLAVNAARDGMRVVGTSRGFAVKRCKVLDTETRQDE